MASFWVTHTFKDRKPKWTYVHDIHQLYGLGQNTQIIIVNKDRCQTVEIPNPHFWTEFQARGFKNIGMVDF